MAAPLSRTAQSVYRALLRLLPTQLRRRHQAEMLDLFDDLYVDSYRKHGFAGALKHSVRAAVGLIRVAIGERFSAADRFPPPLDGDSMLSTLRADARQAARALRRTPTFTAVSILTLALGIGATTAIFSLVHGVVIQGLPYDEADELIYVDHQAPEIGFESGLGSGPGHYRHYSDYATLIDGLSYWEEFSVTVLLPDAEPERVEVVSASSTLFTTLRVRPLHGQLLTPEDDLPDGPRSALLSHGYWTRRFGASPDVVGTNISIGGNPYSVRGVLPPDFNFRNVAVYIDNNRDYAAGFGGFNGGSIARMVAGTTLAEVAAELDREIAEIDKTHGEPGLVDFLADSGVSSRPIPLKEWVVGPVRQVLWILMGTVGLVMMIAFANVANLFLVRSESRQREIAVRHAMGASRGQVLRGSLAESMLLTLAGCGLGLAIATSALGGLLARIPFDLPRVHEVGLTGSVLGFAVAISLMAGVVFGIMPTLRRQGDLSDALRDGSRSATIGRTRVRTRQTLVVAQIGLSLVLLSGAGLMGRSFAHLAAVDPGFANDNVLTFQIALPRAQYPEISEVIAFHDTMLERLRSLPGVIEAGATRDLPLGGRSGGDVLIRELDPPADGEFPPIVWVSRATPTYFEAMGIPLLRGRAFTQDDQDNGRAVVILDQAAVDVFFGGDDPVGERIQIGADRSGEFLEVIGVVGATKRQSLTEAPSPMAYISTVTGSFNSPRLMSYAIWVDGAPLGIASEARAMIHEMDRTLPIIQLRDMASIVAEAEAPMAFTMMMLGIAAGVATLLGGIGVYGVISYIVGHRTTEIGIRMAVGAAASDVRRLLLTQGAIVAGFGLAVGLGATLVLARLVESQLYEVDPLDPATHLATSLLLLGAVLLATWVPAWRASRIDPNVALRAD